MMFDLHNDFPTCMQLDRYGEYLGSVPDIVTAVIWTSEFESDYAKRHVESITSALRSVNLDQPIAIEDIGFLSVDAAESFDFSQYFYCSLTWNNNNRFAGGAMGDGRLTDAGRRAIRLMNGKCAVDVAHLNKASFYDVLEISERPICTHTGFASHPRCLDDAQIRALISRGALIGLCAVTSFTGAKSASGLAEVIDGFIQKYGIDDLCLGTDFNGSDDLPSDFKSYADLPHLCECLSGLGYSKDDIDKVLYTNAQRFYEEIKNDRHL